MKKLLAVFTALVLVLTGLSAALAEEEAITAQTPFTVNVKLEVNGQILPLFTGGMDEAGMKKANIIAELVKAIGIKAVSDGVDSEVFLSLKDENVLTAAILKDTDNLMVVTDLLPGSILKVSQEDLGMGQQQQLSLDPQVIANVFAGPIAKMIEEINTRTGDAEPVEETIYDVAFTAKIPLNMTAKELELLALNTAKEIVSAEDFSKVLAMIPNATFDPAQLDQTIEAVTNQDEATMPKLDAATYFNSDGDNVMQLLMTQEQAVEGKEEPEVQTMTFRLGNVQGTTIIDTDALGILKLLVKVDNLTGNTEISADISSQGMVIGIAGTVTTVDGVTDAVFGIKLMGMDLGTISVNYAPAGELTGAMTLEGKTEYTLKDIQDPQSENYAAFQQDMQTGLQALLGKAFQIMPDIATLFMPAETPAEEAPAAEAPAEAPAAQ